MFISGAWSRGVSRSSRRQWRSNADENLGRPTRRSTHGYAWPVKEVLAGLQAALKRLRTAEISKFFSSQFDGSVQDGRNFRFERMIEVRVKVL